MILVVWLLAAAAAVAFVWWLLRSFANARPHQIISAGKLFAASFVAMAGMGLLAFGRLGVVGALIGASVLTATRMRAQHRPPDPLPGDAADEGDRSVVETPWLSMSLDRATGEMSGQVKQGRLVGQSLAALSLDQLLALRQEIAAAEPSSLPLVDTWLDRAAPDWRERDRDQRGDEATFHSGNMDEAQALDILGLRPGAGRAEIEAAYRRVMAQVHPDKGGSNRLASLVNAARAFLLNRG
ncbi:MAG TPA: DnaJ domain-containing protein [Geminicoccus sp.]|jgi:hypothetical protein|uniref:DnaJ domain-containing protein n=1 Tax=Geminicoccus sp. TaxID=2024832 RepID=UPI002E304EFA|nr:DnaJ domain-containing protein [Geminicoccus sp.]HEX2529627.1 DnaJ domain-containing protein [Geminicoccus sp.]